MQVPGLQDGASLGIELVEIILRRREVDVLNSIVAREQQWLREYLLRSNSIEVAWQFGSEDAAKVGAAYYGRIHVVITVALSASVLAVFSALDTYVWYPWRW